MSAPKAWDEISEIDQILYAICYKNEDGVISYYFPRAASGSAFSLAILPSLEQAQVLLKYCQSLRTFTRWFDFKGTPAYPEARILSFNATNFKAVEEV